MGVPVLSVIITTVIRLMALVQRIIGTASAGTIRRDLMNALSIYILNNHGHVVYGDYIATVHHSSLCYGHDGLAVIKIMSPGVFSKFIKMPVEKIYNAYFYLDSGSEKLQSYAKDSWAAFKPLIEDLKESILLLSRGGLIDAGYYMKISVPFAVEHRIDLDTKFSLENAEANFLIAGDCLNRINNIYTNEINHVKDDFIVKSKLKIVIMYLLFSFSPNMLGKIDKDKMKAITQDIYLKYIDPIERPGTAVGMIAASNQSKTMVQNSLDAPKKQADNAIIENEKTHNRIMFPKGILTGTNIYTAPLLEEYHNADIKNDIINRIVEDNLTM